MNYIFLLPRYSQLLDKLLQWKVTHPWVQFLAQCFIYVSELIGEVKLHFIALLSEELMAIYVKHIALSEK